MSWRLDLIAGATSALALAVLLIFDSPPLAEVARRAGAALAGFAAFVTALSPLLGWQTKARQFNNLHFGYGQLFGQIESAIANIRRSGEITPEQIGASRLVHEAFLRLEALDELEPQGKLIDKLDAKVRTAFPDDYVWTNF